MRTTVGKNKLNELEIVNETGKQEERKRTCCKQKEGNKQKLELATDKIKLWSSK